jgi:uncharacterized membrane protein YesL
VGIPRVYLRGYHVRG